MNINILSDEELAKEIYNRSKMSIHPSWKDIGGSKVLRKQALKISRFTRLCVKDSQKELVEALKGMIEQYGGMVDGGVEKPAAIAVYRAKQALASVEGKDNHVA